MPKETAALRKKKLPRQFCNYISDFGDSAWTLKGQSHEKVCEIMTWMLVMI
jgi:hypothetical protein